jgi:hypothetical protein
MRTCFCLFDPRVQSRLYSNGLMKKKMNHSSTELKLFRNESVVSLSNNARFKILYALLYTKYLLILNYL